MPAEQSDQPAKPASQRSAFISYAKADAKKAQEVARSLEQRGLTCWIAPRDVKVGRTYGDEIIRGIETSRTLVLILSEAANKSPFVAREVERAVSKRRPVFCVRIEDIGPSPSLELFIASTQWIDAWSGPLAPHVDDLAALIAEEEGIDPASLIASKPGKASLPKWAYAALLVAVLAVVGAVAWTSYRGAPDAVNTDTAIAKPPERDLAAELWPEVRDSDDVAVLEAFIAKFGNTFHADLAKARLAKLTKPEEPEIAGIPRSDSPPIRTSRQTALAAPSEPPASEPSRRHLHPSQLLRMTPYPQT